jgi:hypothetical protein
MNKLKKITIIFIINTLIVSLLAVITLNYIFIVGGIASFAIASFYLYLNKARQTFKRDLIDNMR